MTRRKTSKAVSAPAPAPEELQKATVETVPPPPPEDIILLRSIRLLLKAILLETQASNVGLQSTAGNELRILADKTIAEEGALWTKSG